jgi:RNA polymerase sigma factor (sigma-70 family)
MKIHWTFRNCDSDKQNAKTHLEKKVRSLTRRINRLRVDRCSLDLTLYHHTSRESWELRAVLRMPTGSLVANDERHNLPHVIDEVIGDLTRQLRRHKARVRKEHVTRRRRQRCRDFVTAESYLAQDVKQDRRGEFFALLTPLLHSVKKHAEYELRVLEIEEAIPIGELIAEDLVDEVIQLAYDRYRLRPPESLLETWLMELLHERLTELSSVEPPVSLIAEPEVHINEDDEAATMDIEDVKYWMSHVFESDETVRFEELIPDDNVADSLAALAESEEQRNLEKHLNKHLNKLPKRQRQAVMLHDASGFEVSEIAEMLQVTNEQAESLIDKARRTLRNNLANYHAPDHE